MPGEIMSREAASPAWFGKIPAAGDFVSRRFPHEQQRVWDDWIRSGLLYLQQVSPDQWQTRFSAGPIWNFLVPPTPALPVAQCGLIAPSIDRVGRLYPLCIVQSAPADSVRRLDVTKLAGFYATAGAIVREAFRQRLSVVDIENQIGNVQNPFEGDTQSKGDILSILGDAALHAAVGDTDFSTLPRIDLHAAIQSGLPYGIWWTSIVTRQRYLEVTHEGNLTTALFMRLYHEGIDGHGA